MEVRLKNTNKKIKELQEEIANRQNGEGESGTQKEEKKKKKDKKIDIVEDDDSDEPKKKKKTKSKSKPELDDEDNENEDNKQEKRKYLKWNKSEIRSVEKGIAKFGFDAEKIHKRYFADSDRSL